MSREDVQPAWQCAQAQAVAATLACANCHPTCNLKQRRAGKPSGRPVFWLLVFRLPLQLFEGPVQLLQRQASQAAGSRQQQQLVENGRQLLQP